MKEQCIAAAFFLIFLLLLIPRAASVEVNEYHLETGMDTAKGTVVTYYLIQADNPGPTIFITAGIHGDEPAGIYAALKLIKLKPDKGKLYIFPLLNPHGYKHNSRDYLNGLDLNRCFPGEKGENPGEKLASALFNLIREKADLLIDLHESEHYLVEDGNYLGQSVIAGKRKKTILYALYAVEKLNETIEKDIERFVLTTHPVKGSLVWAADRYLEIPSYVVETCKEERLSRRVHYQLKVIEYLLTEIGVRIDDQSLSLFP